jgi:xanthine dehydrogenase YagS FAD-binding subunit
MAACERLSRPAYFSDDFARRHAVAITKRRARLVVTAGSVRCGSQLPGGTPERDTNLEPDELIIGVELPPPPPGPSAASAARPVCRLRRPARLPPPPPGPSTHRKVCERASYAFALVSVAALLDVADDGVVREARLALGGRGPCAVAGAARGAGAARRPATEDAFARAAAGSIRPEPGRCR